MDFLSKTGEAMVLARLLTEAAGNVVLGSYRVNDFVDKGDGRAFVVMLKRVNDRPAAEVVGSNKC